MEDLLRSLDPSLTILGNEPHADFEMKLLVIDSKIFNNVENGNLEAVARLTELREAVIEERFILTDKYIVNRNAVIAELEPQEVLLLQKGNTPGARRIQFEKYRRIFRAQEQFLAQNYPVKFFCKERLKGWNEHGSVVSSSK
jgi:hypothetical protein